MRKCTVLITLAVCILLLSSCKQLQERVSGFNRNSFGNELTGTSRIIFKNYKENASKFTVADSKVIKQIVDIMGKSGASSNVPGVPPDYTISFYIQNGRQISFDYWMGASQNSKGTNLKDDKDLYYKVPDNLDTYIINSIKMFERPEKFVELYSACLNDSISSLKKGNGNTIVGIDMKSDRRMQKYSISYEEEILFKHINVEGFDIQPYMDGGKYTYLVTFVTNMYNPQKAQITVEAMNTESSIKQVSEYQPKLINGTWQINRVK